MFDEVYVAVLVFLAALPLTVMLHFYTYFIGIFIHLCIVFNYLCTFISFFLYHKSFIVPVLQVNC